jgi:hypothetical protein
MGGPLTNGDFASARCVPFSGPLFGKDGFGSDNPKDIEKATKRWYESVNSLEKLVAALNTMTNVENLDPTELHNEIVKALSTKYRTRRCSNDNTNYHIPGNHSDYKVKYCGGLTGFMVLPMLICSGLVPTSFIPAAKTTAINEKSTYVKRLSELKFNTKPSRNHLLRYLAKQANLCIGVVENGLCKLFRANQVFDLIWHGMYLFSFQEKTYRKHVVT